ncbi:hypothetical protein DHD32_13695 [Arenibacter sp. TNZ]|uniref:Ig-like domain-containing protein n=1 Tax=Arenibacter TaxID=178469 RepID=UPI000CD47C95|nr:MULTISPECIES: Ig-like domain-containing protein [Arenibacter]MCM4172539.1 hypothetical protein [Arenibacter sp. TNZ]
MKITPPNLLQVTLSCLVLFLNFSCNKDSDLLAEYVVEDNPIGTEPKEVIIDLANAVFTTDEDQPVSFNMLYNTTSKRKGRRRYKGSSKPKYGNITIEKDSIAVYTPSSDYNGKDNIEITLEETNEDETTSEVVVTVDVTVEPVTDVVEDIIEVPTEAEPEAPIVIEPLKNDTFNKESEVIITEVSEPSNGTAVINEDNTITYTPNTNNPEEVITEEVTSETEEVVTEEIPAEKDTFTYTTSVTNPDDTVTEETGSVTVTVADKTPTEPTSPTDMGALKAFPGAEGFGKNTTGGRGGIVVEVTNLNDSGSGSLRSALSLKGKRTIVFKVAGNINLNSYLSIGPDNGDLTIAGQTAPGGGITIANHGIRIQGSNTIVRYVRFRPGNSADTGEDAVTIVAYSGRTTKNVILDHCSISWGKDENFNIGAIGGAGVNNVTLQNSIVAENIDTGYGVLLWSKATNISFHQNLLAHNKARNIRSSTCTSDFEFINNVVYSFGSGMQPTFENKFDIVGNVFISNPNVSKPSTLVKIEASTNNCPDGILSKTQAYLSDNTYDGSNISVESELKSYLENSKIFNSGISAIPNAQVKSTVLSKVGTSLYRDSLDERIIDDVNNRTGKIPGSAGGYPDLPKGTAYSDSDKDGMSNEWETVNALNPNDAGDSNKDRDSDGYTNLEEYLHYLTKS